MTFLRLVRAGVLAIVLVGLPRWSRRKAPAVGRDASAAAVASFALTQQMPVDPEVSLGTLPNGMKYYVRPNLKPARRVELRLVVKAGSVLEDPDQLGLAHFVEHMLFEGTTNFPGNGINDFLASLGLGIGADANAQTSYDDTQYICACRAIRHGRSTARCWS
jgi:zinc protease